MVKVVFQEKSFTSRKSLSSTKLFTKRTDLEVPLFLSNFRKRLSKRSAQRIFEQYGIGAHMLRHTYGRELVASGIDLATVADLMGHNDVNTTKRYAPSMSDLEQAVEKIFNS